MAIPLNSWVSVNFLGFCFGQRIMLTTTYQKQTGPVVLTTPDELNNLIDELIAGGSIDILTTWLAVLPPEFSTSNIRAQKFDTDREAYINRVVVTPGTNGLSATVANDSAALTLRAAGAGRNQVATKKIGPLPDASSAAGLLTGGTVSLLTDLGVKMVAPVTLPGGEGYRPSIFHRGPPSGGSDIETFIIGPQSRVQRRRTVGLGE